MPSKTFTVDQETTLNGMPYWIYAEVTVHASLEKHYDQGEFWGTAYSTTSYTPQIESAEIESIEVCSYVGGEEQHITDELVLKAAKTEAVKIAMKNAEEDDFQ
jgi:tRNA(Leu) C34 or U34 (ribose-2'-O)-methylase TrmL